MPADLAEALEKRDARWWLQEPEVAHEEVWRVAMKMRDEQGVDREQDADDALALYFGNTRNGIRQERSLASYFGAEEPPGYNVIQACVDTKVNHLCRNKIKVMLLTVRGSPEEHERAIGMQRAVEAIFDEVGLYGQTGVDICFDGNLFEAGAIKFAPDYANMRVLGERVFPWEIGIPKREARLGKPRQMAHWQLIDRSVLLDYFAGDGDNDEDKAERERIRQLILDAPSVSYDTAAKYDDVSEEGNISDMVLVTEMWHLPSGRVDKSDPKAFGYDADGNEVEPGHDGLHIICLKDGTLLREPWPYSYFPIAFFRPMKKPIGFWSRSLPETLAGAQLALERMNKRVDGIMHLHSRPLLVAWRRAKINTGKISNAWANILESDQPPGSSLQYIVPQSVPADYLNRIDKVIAWAEKQAGLSELQIAAQKPPGVEHAPALQHLSEEGAIRHTTAYRALEDMHVDGFRIVIDCLRSLSRYAKAKNEKFEVIWGGDKELVRIDWDEVDLDDSKFKMRRWPTNLLPSTPTAKMSRILEFLKSGLLTPQQVMMALGEDYPDIEAIVGNTTSAEKNVKEKLDQLVKHADFEKGMAHPYINTAMGKVMAFERINQLEADGEKQEVIDRVIQFWEDCNYFELKRQADEAAAAQGIAPTAPGTPGGAPPPAPGAPPTGGGEPMPAPANIAA